MGVTDTRREPVAQLTTPEDELLASIRTAQIRLAQAAAAPEMRREPLQLILAALSSSLEVFGASSRRWDNAVADVVAARDPLPREEKEALVQELVAATRQGAYDAMRKEAARMVRVIDHGLFVRIGLAVGGAYVAGALSVWAFILLRAT